MDDRVSGDQVFLTVIHHPFDVGRIIVEGRKRNALLVFPDRMDVGKAVLPAVFRVAVVLQDLHQQLFVGAFGVLGVLVNPSKRAAALQDHALQQCSGYDFPKLHRVYLLGPVGPF